MSKVFELINDETRRQKNGLELIPSENYVSKNVLKALGSILTDKYSEGYPGRRYYGGNEVIDEIEKYCQQLANKLFGTVYANVQPYSGSPANLAVDLALASPGDVILGLSLSSGGHLTHGASPSYTGKLFKAVQYGVDKSGKVDLEEVRKLAQENKPKIIWVGGTAYLYRLEFEQFAEIAEEVGAYLVADISHVAGLIVGGIHPDPAQYVDIITTTTHKTLRGPRGAMILITQKGIDKDSELPKKIDASVFPGLQGGPHDNTTAAIAVALEEADSPEFDRYAEKILINAQVLAVNLKEKGIKLIGDGTENHLMLIDVGVGRGYIAQIALEVAGITVNRNSIPGDSSPFYPSGVRIGTPALTSRGMGEQDMKKVADWIAEVLEEIKNEELPVDDKKADFIKEFKIKMADNEILKKVKREVEQFASRFPVPGVD